MKKLLWLFSALIICSSNIYGQKKVEKAVNLMREGTVYLDKGDLKNGIKSLKKAFKLDPQNKSIAYELAYAYYKNAEYKKGVETLEKILGSEEFDDYKGFIPDLYSKAGIDFKHKLKPPPKKEPSTAKEFNEEAKNLMSTDKEKALAYFEKAIDLDPKEKENYYYAAKLYSETPEQLWAIIYAEIYILLEPEGTRSEEMKELLLTSYKKGIIIKGGGQYELKLSNRKAEYMLQNFDPKNFKVNFEQSYVTTYELCVDRLNEGGFRISNLYFMRKAFIGYWFRGKELEYPSFLFDYHKKMIDNDVFEGYHYWLFKTFFPQEYNDWKKIFEKQLTKFENWFAQNKISVSDDKRMNTYYYMNRLEGVKK